MLVKRILQSVLCALVLFGAGCASVSENTVAVNASTAVEATEAVNGGGLQAAVEVVGGMVPVADEEQAVNVESVSGQEEVQEENMEMVVAEEVEAEKTIFETAPSEPAQETTVVTPTIETTESVESAEPEETKQEEQTPVEEVQKIAVSVAVVSPQGERSTYSVKVDEGETVEVAMKKARDKGLSYSVRQFGGMGAYVEAINGTEESGGLYWVFYVNNTRAIQGISTYVLTDGDEVLWKFRAPGAAD